MSPELVLCTTGTSIARNLAGAAESFDTWLDAQPSTDREVLVEQRPDVEDASRCVQAGRWRAAGLALAQLRGAPRVLGAEVTSLLALLQEPRFESAKEVALIHSDTGEGRGCAVVIRELLRSRLSKSATLLRVRGLQLADLGRFRVEGLRNLVRVLADGVRLAGHPRRAVICVTGGFKAEVGLATVFGQVMGVDVIYRHESFPDLGFIQLPPLPVSFDVTAVPENLDILVQRAVPTGVLHERFSSLTDSDEAFSRFRCFLEEGPQPRGSGEIHLVSPLGQLGIEVWTRQASRGPLPKLARSTGLVRLGRRTEPAGAREHCSRLGRDFRFIVRIDRVDRGCLPSKGVSYRLGAAAGVPPILSALAIAGGEAIQLCLTTTASCREEQEAALAALLTHSLGAEPSVERGA